jgi:transposase
MQIDLTDEEWVLLQPLLPKRRIHDRVDDRKVMNAIFYVLRTGAPWRSLPQRYGPYTTAYNRLNRWSRRGIWQRLVDRLPLTSRATLCFIDGARAKARGIASGEKRVRKIKLPVPAAMGPIRHSMPPSPIRDDHSAAS